MAIRNKDVLEIQAIPQLMLEIVSLERRIEWERARMKNTTQRFSALPRGGGVNRAMETAEAEIDDAERQHSALKKQYTARIKKAEAVLAAIENSRMRTLVRLLYLDGISPSAVQGVMQFGRYAFENARAAIEEADDMKSVKWVGRE